MSRKRHIDTRNLVVCDTFDEFAEKVGQCDQNVGDIVGYVTSVSRVFYWLNVESVWGVLGFTWEPSSLQPIEGVPYLEERLEHVEVSGAIIDYSQKDAAWKLAHAVTKGYGHFNATTMPFTIIPKLPDGYRITEFRNTFNLIESDYIEVQKSDWSNLTEINYLIPRRKSINIDITGANLSSNSKVLINDLRNSGDNLDWKSTVYIKGDLGNCTNGWFEGNIHYQWVNSHTIIVDDNNKGLNLPISLYIQNQFYYTNPDKEFDARDWLKINELTYTDNRWAIVLLAASKKYLIDNKLANDIYATTGTMQISLVASLGITPESFDGTLYKITDPIAQEIEPCTITYDCTEDNNTREDKLFNIIGTLFYRDSNNQSVYPYDVQCYNPIIYKGNINSITMWNPFCLVKDDNDWPEYSQSMVDKLTKFDGYTPNIPGTNIYGINQGYFMYGAYIYLTQASPYTIDCTNIRYLNLFERAHFIINDYSQFEIVGTNTKVLELVKLTNTNNLISFSVFANTVTDFYIKLPSIKTVFFCFDTATLGFNKRFYIPEGCKVEAAAFPMMWYNGIMFGKSSAKAFKLRHIDCRNYGLPYSAYLNVTAYNPVVNDNIYDFIELEDGITSDTDFLKNCYANTVKGFFGNNRTIRHPFIVVNTNLEISGLATNWSIESSFVFIYKANIIISHATSVYTSDMTQCAYNAFEAILPGIQVNNTTNTYTIKLKKSVFDLLTENEKNYIMNTLNYTLTYDI